MLATFSNALLSLLLGPSWALGAFSIHTRECLNIICKTLRQMGSPTLYAS